MALLCPSLRPLKHVAERLNAIVCDRTSTRVVEIRDRTSVAFLHDSRSVDDSPLSATMFDRCVRVMSTCSDNVVVQTPIRKSRGWRGWRVDRDRQGRVQSTSTPRARPRSINRQSTAPYERWAKRPLRDARASHARSFLVLIRPPRRLCVPEQGASPTRR